MQTPVSDIESYGLALWKTAKFIEGESLVGHTGSAYGLYSCMFLIPKRNSELWRLPMAVRNQKPIVITSF